MPEPTQPGAMLTGTPPMGSSPVSVPSGNPGDAAMAASKIYEAIQIINTQVSKLQPGTEQHRAAIKAIEGLGKAFPASEKIPGQQRTTLQGMQREAEQSAPLQALMRQQQMGGGGAAAGAPPGAAGAGAPPPG